MNRFTVPIRWKTTDDGGAMEGYASTFGNVDLGGDVVVPGAFTKTIANIRANGIPLLADHIPSTTSVLGTIYDAAETDEGLWIKARISKAASAQDVRVKLLEGHLNRLSIGYETMDEAYEDRDGQRVKLLKELKLWETSVVVFPMNTSAAIARVKAVIDALPPAERDVLVRALDTPGEADEAPPSTSAADEATEPTNPTAADEAALPSDEDATGWDRYASEAVLAGRDPDATTDPAKRAGLATTLELLEADLERLAAPTDPTVRAGMARRLELLEADIDAVQTAVPTAIRADLSQRLVSLESPTDT